MKNKNYTKEETACFKKLYSPQKIQDFLNTIPFNFLVRGVTLSPRMVLKKNTADCFEGAVFAAAVLEFHGYTPLILDLRSVKKPYDYDHVVAVWKQYGCFGAISKTNHAVLRYREPVYKTVRELVMSYFHEYFLNTGAKTLREYSDPFNLNHFNKIQWQTTDKDISEISEYLDTIRHHSILSLDQIKNLRKADNIEIEAGKICEYKKLKK